MTPYFSDNAIISVRSGDGGAGRVSFRREKFVPKGGPDGGDGGDGGNVIVRVSSHERTLRTLKFKKSFSAENGFPGQKRRKHGRNGDDAVILVPMGTVLTHEDGMLIADLREPGEEVVVLHGGLGGRGNVHFVSSVRQAPLYAQGGLPGIQMTLVADLELCADIGFIGYPNVGKSTLLKVLTNAHPKIANYPFTTLIPNLGTMRDHEQEVILEDIPGLIEGAAEGHGLGTSFLKHVKRNNILVFVLDVSGETLGDDADSVNMIYDILEKQFLTLRNELSKYDELLLHKPYLIVLSKSDAFPAATEIVLDTIANMAYNSILPPQCVSAISHIGIDTLKKSLFHATKIVATKSLITSAQTRR